MHWTTNIEDTPSETGGVYSGDLAGPWLQSTQGGILMLVVSHRATKRRYVCWLPDKRSSTVANAVTEMVFTRWSWRWHSDQSTESTSTFDVFLRDLCIIKASAGGYDSAANGQADSAIQDTERWTRCLFPQARFCGG